MSTASPSQLPPEFIYNRQLAEGFYGIARDLRINPIGENVTNAVKINLNGELTYYDRKDVDRINKVLEDLKGRKILDLTRDEEPLLDVISTVTGGTFKEAGASAAADAKAATASVRAISGPEVPPLVEDFPSLRELDQIEATYRAKDWDRITSSLSNLARRMGISESEIKSTSNLFLPIRERIMRTLLEFHLRQIEPAVERDRSSPWKSMTDFIQERLRLQPRLTDLEKAKIIEDWLPNMSDPIEGRKVQFHTLQLLPSAIVQYIKNILKKNPLQEISFEGLSPTFNLADLRQLNLQSLGFINCKLDLADLRQLNLLSLNLIRCELVDITALGKMTQLRNLSLKESQIKDIKALGEMVDLEGLDIGSNQIRDISVLRNLKKLLFLRIENNPIDSLAVVSKLPNLALLIISKDQEKSLEPQLKELRASRPDLQVVAM